LSNAEKVQETAQTNANTHMRGTGQQHADRYNTMAANANAVQ
jgi:hypothetical protein